MTSLADAFWRMPGSFAAASILGHSYLLRCVVFHHISDTPSPFTDGIRVRVTPSKFEAALKFFTANFNPVNLQDVLTDCDGHGLPPRAILVTFDDAYASIAEWAAPLCQKLGVPAVFFVNAAFLDNQRLAPDNLICYVANTFGMEAINSAVHIVPGHEDSKLRSLAEVFGTFLPSISLAERETFLDGLRHLSDINESKLAKDANLYLTSKQLRDLKSYNFEIGNHTYTHTHCRTLSRNDVDSEVDKNKAELEALSGTKIRSFSIPYGSSKDLSPEFVKYLEQSGHQAIFLSESVANSRQADIRCLDRVSTSADGDDALFFEIEVLPRLRVIRNRFFRKSAFVRGNWIDSPALDRVEDINANAVRR